jgi:hypothetical protein
MRLVAPQQNRSGNQPGEWSSCLRSSTSIFRSPPAQVRHQLSSGSSFSHRIAKDRTEVHHVIFKRYTGLTDIATEDQHPNHNANDLDNDRQEMKAIISDGRRVIKRDRCREQPEVFTEPFSRKRTKCRAIVPDDAVETELGKWSQTWLTATTGPHRQINVHHDAKCSWS